MFILLCLKYLYQLARNLLVFSGNLTFYVSYTVVFVTHIQALSSCDLDLEPVFPYDPTGKMDVCKHSLFVLRLCIDIYIKIYGGVTEKKLLIKWGTCNKSCLSYHVPPRTFMKRSCKEGIEMFYCK